MHAKEAWNDRGEVLFGSANVVRWAMDASFDCCLRLQKQSLVRQLDHAFLADTAQCVQPGEKYDKRPLLPKTA